MASQRITFFLSFAVFAGAAFLSYNEACLLLDPYNVVWRRREMPKAAWAIEQLRSAEIEHLAKHPDIYDTLIVADSRGSWSNIREVNRVTNSRLFSLNASGDTPIGFLPKIRWSVHTQTKLRRIILYLSLGQFQVAPQRDFLLFHEHPYVTGESWVSYYWTFSNLPYQTFLRSAGYYVQRIIGLSKDGATIINSGFDEETGELTLFGQSYSEFVPTDEDRAKYQSLVSSDPPGRLRFHDSALELADVAASLNADQPIREDQVRSFIELLEVMRANGIQAECVVMPVPVAGLRLISPKLFLEWLHLVVQHCDAIWDFSVPGPITGDNYNYRDVGHFLPYVSKMMLVRVLGGELPELRKYPDFGVRVPAREFETHRDRWERAMMCWERFALGDDDRRCSTPFVDR
jgi:hypothetical protein